MRLLKKEILTFFKELITINLMLTYNDNTQIKCILIILAHLQLSLAISSLRYLELQGKKT